MVEGNNAIGSPSAGPDAARADNLLDDLLLPTSGVTTADTMTPDVVPQCTPSASAGRQATPPDAGPVDLLGDIGAPAGVAIPAPMERDSLERDVLDRDSLDRDFDPVASWGQPLGLPAPDNGPAAAAAPGAKKKAAPAASAPRASLGGRMSLGGARSATKTATNGRTEKAADGGAKNGPAKRPPAPPGGRKPRASMSAVDATRVEATAAAAKGKAEARAPAAARLRPEAARTEALRSKPPVRLAPPKSAPATPRGRQGAPGVPAFVDLTYVPCHGDAHHVDAEFFRRVRARYVVLSAGAGAGGGGDLLRALLEGKKDWPAEPVTLISTYDSESLAAAARDGASALRDANISLAPAADRCTIQLQDHETSCNAFRLEFTAPPTV